MQVKEREKQNYNHTVRKRFVRELKVISTLKLLAHFYTRGQCEKAVMDGSGLPTVLLFQGMTWYF